MMSGSTTPRDASRELYVVWFEDCEANPIRAERYPPSAGLPANQLNLLADLLRFRIVKQSAIDGRPRLLRGAVIEFDVTHDDPEPRWEEIYHGIRRICELAGTVPRGGRRWDDGGEEIWARETARNSIRSSRHNLKFDMKTFGMEMSKSLRQDHDTKDFIAAATAALRNIVHAQCNAAIDEKSAASGRSLSEQRILMADALAHLLWRSTPDDLCKDLITSRPGEVDDPAHGWWEDLSSLEVGNGLQEQLQAFLRSPSASVAAVLLATASVEWTYATRATAAVGGA